MTSWQRGTALLACGFLAVAPLASQAAIIGSSSPNIGWAHQERWGAIEFHPNSITIGLQLGKGGSATFRVSQKNREGGPYQGQYRGTIQCQGNLLGKPRLDIDGNQVTVMVPRQNQVLSVLCSATIVGGGGVSGQEPITIDVGL